MQLEYHQLPLVPQEPFNTDGLGEEFDEIDPQIAMVKFEPTAARSRPIKDFVAMNGYLIRLTCGGRTRDALNLGAERGFLPGSPNELLAYARIKQESCGSETIVALGAVAEILRERKILCLEVGEDGKRRLTLVNANGPWTPSTKFFMIGGEAENESVPAERTPLAKVQQLIYPDKEFRVQVDSAEPLDLGKMNGIFSWCDPMWDEPHRDVYIHESLRGVPIRLGQRRFMVKRFLWEMTVQDVDAWAKKHGLNPATLVETAVFVASRPSIGRREIVTYGTYTVSDDVAVVPMLLLGSGGRRLLDSVKRDICHPPGTSFLLVGD